jgi:Putative restriction endonuclease
MTQTLSKLVTYEEFIEWLPDGKRYELHDGVIVEMSQPTGKHEKVTSFLTLELAMQVRSMGVPYLLPKTALVKPPQRDSGYFPDILLLTLPDLKVQGFLFHRESNDLTLNKLTLSIPQRLFNEGESEKLVSWFPVISYTRFWVSPQGSGSGTVH